MDAFCVGVWNNNGPKLLELCAELRFCKASTASNHKAKHKTTYKLPDGQTKNLIDYVNLNSNTKSFILQKKVHRGCDVPSDHMLVISILKVNRKIKKSVR